jgi:hypothetical protein
MNRRKLMTLAGGLPLMSTAYAQSPQSAFRRSRRGDPSWPSAAQWAELDAKVGDKLIQVRSPLEACRSAPESAECAAVFRGLKNPWYIGDNVALTRPAAGSMPGRRRPAPMLSPRAALPTWWRP